MLQIHLDLRKGHFMLQVAQKQGQQKKELAY